MSPNHSPATAPVVSASCPLFTAFIIQSSKLSVVENAHHAAS